MLLVNLLKPEYKARPLRPYALVADRGTSALRKISSSKSEERLGALINSFRTIQWSLSETKRELSTWMDSIDSDQVDVYQAQRNYEKAIAKIREVLGKTEYGTSNPLAGYETARLADLESGKILGILFGFFSEELNGSTLRINHEASRSFLKGRISIDSNFFLQETELVFWEGDKRAEVRIDPTQTAETLVEEIEKCIEASDFHFEVSLDEDKRLILESRKAGSEYIFSAMSKQTTALSSIPGETRAAISGKNIEISLNGRVIQGKGREIPEFLSHRPGATAFIAQENLELHRDYILKINEKGMNRDGQEMFSFPLTEPENLGTGVKNHSRFVNLANLMIIDSAGLKDARLIFQAAIEETESLFNDFEERTNECLSVLSESSEQGEIIKKISDAEFFSYEKANEMSSRMKKILMQTKEISHI